MQQAVINSEEVRTAVINYLSGLPLDPILEIIICEWEEPGTHDQLKLIHKYYGELAKYKPEHSKDEWENYCKYNLGIQILIFLEKDKPDKKHFEFFNRLLKKFPKTDPLWYEKRLMIMPAVEVVGIMNIVQRSKYIKVIQNNFYDIPLTIPPPKDERYGR